MKKGNKELMAEAKVALSGKWVLAIKTFFVYWVVVSAISFLVMVLSVVFKTSLGVNAQFGPIAAIINLLQLVNNFVVSPVMTFGFMYFFLLLSRGQTPELTDMFTGFNRILTIALTSFFKILFILLWSLLFIIPGILASLSYSQTFFILADDSSIGALDAIKKSKEMMYGHRNDYAYLLFRFFGLTLLCFLTLGIGFIWLIPYTQVTFAKFYDDIKAAQNEEAQAPVTQLEQTEEITSSQE
jgi:uncharacterized membrane protein